MGIKGGGSGKIVTFFEKFCNWANMLDDYNWQKGAFHDQNWQKMEVFLLESVANLLSEY